MRPSQGSKRREMGEQHIGLVTKLFHDAQNASLATITDAHGLVTTSIIAPGQEAPPAPLRGHFGINAERVLRRVGWPGQM